MTSSWLSRAWGRETALAGTRHERPLEGEWRVRPDGGAVVDRLTGRPVCFFGPAVREGERNARALYRLHRAIGLLVAAAPDLLLACRAALAYVRDGRGQRARVAGRLEAALAKIGQWL